ncbi:uncharacterized protein AB675_12034 [Cyphellophora attinorum]|uniref:F-box domain-containing protein n=1 Tax=Cyphellophora attinorum TaxID=1664694 RepID=A0A0N0NKZ5_9EURO|nr:uncharacterized protein AB675_12034 [Phialophora attinorum]KPI38439.1 hypothetical protein AB675_12034 [Phialophora attinorum]
MADSQKSVVDNAAESVAAIDINPSATTVTATVDIPDSAQDPGIENNKYNQKCKHIEQSHTETTSSSDLKAVDAAESSTESLTKSTLTKPGDLSVFPDEIIESIFEALLGNSTLHVVCFDPVESEDFSPSKHIESRDWDPAWVPGLRLVCKYFKDVATPVIARRTDLTVIRRVYPETELPYTPLTPLPLAQLCPGYISARTPMISIVEEQAMNHLMPTGSIDVDGFQNLKVIRFGPYDQMKALNTAVRQMQDCLAGQAMRDFAEKLVTSIQGASPAWLTAFIAREGPLNAIKKIIRNVFLPGFAREEHYKAFMKQLVTTFWAIRGDKVVGAGPDVNFIVEFRTFAEVTGMAIIRGDFVGVETCKPWVNHKDTKFLDMFRS